MAPTAGLLVQQRHVVLSFDKPKAAKLRDAAGGHLTRWQGFGCKPESSTSERGSYSEAGKNTEEIRLSG
jgi:hypothetical protein